MTIEATENARLRNELADLATAQHLGQIGSWSFDPRIMRGHGGAIHFDSGPSRGTTATVLFPAVKASRADAPDES